MIKPKIRKLKILGCPEGCRKKFTNITNLNIHLKKKHNLTYKVKMSQGYAYAVTTLSVQGG